MNEQWKGKAWWEFRRRRPDITDYVIHWIKPRYEHERRRHTDSLTVLLEILECGYLKPSFAVMRPLLFDHSPRPTIKGPYPAVCFTEQTLDCFSKSCRFKSERYSPYGIAFHKRALYEYGGRPVIYGSEDMLGRRLGPNDLGYEEGKEIYVGGLPKEFQYLWARYSPIPCVEGYPIDFTHEREWRARIKAPYQTVKGGLPEQGIPLLLPAVMEGNTAKSYAPKILVHKKDERELLTEVVRLRSANWKKECKTRYLQDYFEQLPKFNVIVIEEVEEHIEAGDQDWAKIETVSQEPESPILMCHD